MSLRLPLLAGAICAALAAPAGPASAAPVAPDHDAGGESTAWRWSWGTAVERWSSVSSEVGGWLDRLPELAGSYGTRLQLHLRDLAAESQAMLARLLPFVPAPPDLSPLMASPVPGVESSGFGWRRDPIHRRGKFHKGTDFRADRGTPVYAAGAGLVAFTGRQSGYGNVIYVDHGGGVVTRYAHLSRIEVKAGAPVEAGGRIGRVGATGRATGPHLHFEVRLAGRAVDPTLAMQVAELQRTDPAAARLAAIGLSADAQAQRVDRHDPVRPRTAAAARPERRRAPVRDRHLW